MTGYEAFCLYSSLKLHFTQESYDYFKYGGKSRTSIDAFENKKDKWFYYKLSRRFTNDEQARDFLVANFLHDRDVWIGNLLREDSDIHYRARQKVIQSLSYTFTNEIESIIGYSPIQNTLEDRLKTDWHMNMNQEKEEVPIFTNDNNSVIFPIYYDKTIIREQDDHIIVFLNIFFKNNNKTHIITADKFRWYKGELSLKNFRFIYDYNKLCIHLEICAHNTHDMIIYKNDRLLIDNLNYPFLDPKNFNLSSIKNKDISFQSILYLLNYLYIQIKTDNVDYFLFYNLKLTNV